MDNELLLLEVDDDPPLGRMMDERNDGFMFELVGAEHTGVDVNINTSRSDRSRSGVVVFRMAFVSLCLEETGRW